MIICNDMADLKSKIEPAETLALVYVSCKNPAELLHEGHAYLVSSAKTVADKVGVVFCVSTLFDSLRNPDYSWPAFSNAEFDNTGCINWCIDNAVDFYLLHSSILMQDTINLITPQISSQVETAWQTEGYPSYPAYDSTGNNTLYCYYEPVKNWMLGHVAVPKECKFVYSWKDGISRFIMKDFAAKYTTSTVELFDPIPDADGIYLSSTLVLTEDEKDVVKQIPTVVDQVGYSDINLLTQSLNALDTQSLGFNVYRIDVVIGGIVGSSNDFIDVFYQFPGKAGSHPIYKRNVR